MTALAASKPRTFLADHPQVDMRLPVKATTQIYEGGFLMFSGGAVTPVSGAGVFAGVALESVLGLAADGDVTVKVRVLGAMEIAVTTDTTALSNVGVAATVPEATDDNTVRIETGSAITGTLLGKFMRVVTVAAAGVVAISFKAGNIA